MTHRPAPVILALPLAVALVMACNSGESAPDDAGASIQKTLPEAAKRASELKPQEFRGMNGVPSSLKPFDAEGDRAPASARSADLEPLPAKASAPALPAGLKAFPEEEDAPEPAAASDEATPDDASPDDDVEAPPEEAP